MMLAGIDLAWTDKNATGIAYGELDGNTLTVKHVGADVMTPSQIRADLADKNVTGVAVDAPLIIKNQAGMRECERLIGREFGSRKASCMPTNLTAYPNHPAVELATQLESDGFSHIESKNKWQVECYPHPALITVFGLAERLKYKRKKGMRVADQQYGLNRLGALLRSLEMSPVLKLRMPSDVELKHFNFGQEHLLSGKALKTYEDKLDAIVCLYVAALHAMKQTVVHGTKDNGYIVVPKSQRYLSNNAYDDDWTMAPWAVETAYHYYLTATNTWQQNGIVSMTNAALAVEILLKSFRLEPTKNIGATNERYEWRRFKGDGHDLLRLYDDLPASIKRDFVASVDRGILSKYRNFFKDSRYGYKTQADVTHTQALHKIAEVLILKTVKIYRERGCTDVFIDNWLF